MQIGRQAWMQQSSGDLSLQDRVALLRHSLFPVLKQSLKKCIHWRIGRARRSLI